MWTTAALLAVGFGLPTPPQDPPAAPDLWQQLAERFGLYGDLRLRAESSFHQEGKPDRFRGRARLRLGAEVEVTDEVSVGFRVTTGNPDDPNSPHVDFGDVLNSDSISFDRYYATYAPAWCGGLELTGGKFAHGFASNPVYGELVWDADVQPEGLAAAYAFGDVGPLDRLGLYVGEYVLLEQAAGGEATAFVAQGSAGLELSEHLDGSLAVGWYRYSNLTPDGNSSLVGDNQGNAVLDTTMPADGTPDVFVSDFSIVNPILALTYDGWSQPVTFGAEWIHNTEAEIAGDTGYAAGFSVGRAKAKGEWKAWYQFQHVEQDSIFSAFAGDDFLLTTNANTHAGGVKFKLADKIELHLWGMASALDDMGSLPRGDGDQWRVRLDLNVQL